MKNKDARNLGLRLDESTSKDLTAFENATGIEGVTLARNSLKAALTYWKAKGHISFPIVMVDTQKSKIIPLNAQYSDTSMVAEDSTPYGKSKGQ